MLFGNDLIKCLLIDTSSCVVGLLVPSFAHAPPVSHALAVRQGTPHGQRGWVIEKRLPLLHQSEFSPSVIVSLKLLCVGDFRVLYVFVLKFFEVHVWRILRFVSQVVFGFQTPGRYSTNNENRAGSQGNEELGNNHHWQE